MRWTSTSAGRRTPTRAWAKLQPEAGSPGINRGAVCGRVKLLGPRPEARGYCATRCGSNGPGEPASSRSLRGLGRLLKKAVEQERLLLAGS
jgi:hypothetical protein